MHGWVQKSQKKIVDYANTTNLEFIVDLKVLFHGWLIYSYLNIFKLIKCKWLPGECADWFLDNIMTWSYCLHRRYSVRQKNSILTNDHALNREPVPLSKLQQESVCTTKGSSLTKNKGKVFFVAKWSGPLLGRLHLTQITNQEVQSFVGWYCSYLLSTNSLYTRLL